MSLIFQNNWSDYDYELLTGCCTLAAPLGFVKFIDQISLYIVWGFLLFIFNIITKCTSGKKRRWANIGTMWGWADSCENDGFTANLHVGGKSFMKREYSQRWHFYSPVSCLLFWSLMWSESCSQANSFSTAEPVTSRNHTKGTNSESHDPIFLCLPGLIWWVCLNNNLHEKETCQSCPYSFICRWHSKIHMYEWASDQKGLTRHLEPKPGMRMRY